jgi:hypothetical protein
MPSAWRCGAPRFLQSSGAQSRVEHLSERPARLLAALLVLAVASVVFTSRVRDVRSDSRATLALAQEFVQHGTFTLDRLSPEAKRDAAHVLIEKNGHVYSRFPLGSSVLSLPVVAVATVLGVDLERYENERMFQVLIAAAIAVGSVLLLVRIARHFLPPAGALCLAAITWFGTSFASTQATALWSHDFATLLALAAIALALRCGSGERKWCGAAIGACLFFAYLSRPTLSILAPALLAYVAAKNRRAALQAAVVVACLVGAFVAVSVLTLGQPLPDYYLPQRLSGSNYATALFGNLLSPSRGLFVFTPFLLFPLIFFRDARAGLARDRPLVAVALGWPLAHVLLVSRLGHWWGGYSYGPRLMTDILPGLSVLIAVTLGAAWSRRSRPALTVMGVLGAVSIVIHTAQGLYNPAVKRWNAEPSIDRHPELVFDWRYPQFLHTEARHMARLAEHTSARSPTTP